MKFQKKIIVIIIIIIIEIFVTYISEKSTNLNCGIDTQLDLSRPRHKPVLHCKAQLLQMDSILENPILNETCL